MKYESSDISSVSDSTLRGSLAALERAAQAARKNAIQTDTAIVIMRNGKIIRIGADELRRQEVAIGKSGREKTTNV
ncbi:MAG: hypothetical protein LBQ52_05540 [Helicobacteraceae bacterium]|jgi:hypothetical protein|nr:hypothetical protein [Helicobacteraceae bacterium]